MNSHHHSMDATRRDEQQSDAFGHDAPRHDAVPPSVPNIQQQDVSATIDHHSSPPVSNSEPSDMPRRDAVERGVARPDATNRDVSRQDVIDRDSADADDPARQEEPDTNWLDVEQAALLLSNKGISRTIRTIQRLCKRGVLISKLVPTENGTRYIISEHSIEEFVVDHNSKLPSGNFGMADEAIVEGPDISPEPNVGSDGEHKPKAAEDAELHSTHFQQIIELKDQQITMLQSQMDIANAQITVKDEQIGEMLERDHETNHLIQNLQRMIGLPAGRTDSQLDDHAVDTEHSSNQPSME